MKITKWLSAAIIIPTLSLLSTCSDKESLLDSFNRITQDSSAAYITYVSPRNATEPATELDQMSLFFTKYEFETLEDAIEAYNDDTVVGVNVAIRELSEGRPHLFSNTGSSANLWECFDGNAQKVNCEQLAEGYPGSIKSIYFVTDEMRCSKRKCLAGESERVSSVRMTPEMLLSANIVISIENDSGVFSAKSKEAKELFKSPSSNVFPITISRIHAVMQKDEFYEKYPNSSASSKIEMTSVEEDLSAFITIKDAIKKAPLGVAEAFITGNVESDIDNVEGLSALSVINTSKNTLDLMAPAIAIAILLYSILCLNKVDRRLGLNKELPEGVSDSVVYGGDMLSKGVTVTMLFFPAIMCILPPFLMSPQAFMESANAFNLNLNEAFFKYEFLCNLLDTKDGGIQNMILIGLLTSAASIGLGFHCLKKINKQRAIMARQHEVNADDNEATATYSMSYSYSAPNITIDNL